MSHDITAGFDGLVVQASETADTFMRAAVHNIDKAFGAGYARNNPALVIAAMRVASADFCHAMVKLAAQDIRDGLRDLANAKA